jgi:hypothetical protein
MYVCVCVRSNYIALQLAIVLGFLAFLANIAYMYSACALKVVCILEKSLFFTLFYLSVAILVEINHARF